MLRGTVKHVNPRGFGFIIPDGGAHDFFFHMSTLETIAFDQLHEGQRVEFEEATDPQARNRRRAAQVRPIDDAAPHQPQPDAVQATPESSSGE
ncbi:MAG: cold shock domain-containing protein [Thermomicrobiales bacterium]